MGQVLAVRIVRIVDHEEVRREVLRPIAPNWADAKAIRKKVRVRRRDFRRVGGRPSAASERLGRSRVFDVVSG